MSSSSSHRRSKLRLHNYAGDFRSFKFFVLTGGEEGLESKIVIDPKLYSKRNPTGSYPALEIDESGELLFGDLSICRYVLATQHQQQRFSQPRTSIHTHSQHLASPKHHTHSGRMLDGMGVSRSSRCDGSTFEQISVPGETWDLISCILRVRSSTRIFKG